MDLPYLITLVIAAIVVISLVKLLLHGVRYILYAFLVVLIVIFIFGISYTQLMGWIENFLLWVL